MSTSQTLPSKTITSEKNGVRFGLLTAAILVVYTGVAAVAGFLHNIEAGTLDVVILIAGVVLAIHSLRKAQGTHMPYLAGFGTGIITALVASVLLGGFFWILGAIAPGAMKQLQARDLFGIDLGVLIGGLGIILLGTMTGVITSLVAMQYFKAPEHQGMTSED